MTDTKIPQLIFALSVAREIADNQGFATLVSLIDEAIKEAKEEALRCGIVIETETTGSEPID
ncbi:hypothetical protein [Rhizobium grahamii]|uniref:Uncharacterized protein n=1 Tax=Rhizobium grahamii CCGE 502 TaxID=990285 RepID=S3HDV4_9HYPH|nr:hypothetical protein [Rhizobium grahamii]EPE97022.1 hypothetical protein RGCCGE502_17330 [Rhizobium grahamii CCGE 502]